jgi:hypothetical protein
MDSLVAGFHFPFCGSSWYDLQALWRCHSPGCHTHVGNLLYEMSLKTKQLRTPALVCGSNDSRHFFCHMNKVAYRLSFFS